MVWKRLITCITLVMIFALANTYECYAYSIYTEGNLSSTYTTIFEDVVSGISPSKNYVYYRSGQYEYTLAVGDNMKLVDGIVYSTENTDLYIITTASGYNSNYTYSISSVPDFQLSLGDSLVYSNLGDYPLLEERGVLYEYLQTYIIIIFALCCFVRSIFAFTYRLRNK